jgi:hypothetical protein
MSVTSPTLSVFPPADEDALDELDDGLEPPLELLLLLLLLPHAASASAITAARTTVSATPLMLLNLTRSPLGRGQSATLALGIRACQAPNV